MELTKILIVAKEIEAGDAYANVLSGLGIAYDLAASITEMSKMAVENAYNGMLIDILTLVRSSKEEKVIAYECINLYPVLRVKWDCKKKQVNLSPLEQSFCTSTESVLHFFVENRCRTFPARTLRRHSRKSINLNLIFSTESVFRSQCSEESFTTSISMGGAFLHTRQMLTRGQSVWLRPVELSDQTPIAATVCWSLEWGLSRGIPGVGLKFGALSDVQARYLKSVLNGQ